MTTLPKSFLGNWRGTLTIAPPLKGHPATLPMELRVQPVATGRWSWTLVYDGQPRAYEMAATDRPDAFLLDEKNGITMDAFLTGDDRIECVFDVDGQLLISRYQRVGATLRYEIRSWKRGDVTRPDGGTNQVTAFRLVNTQSATLKR